jgi:hypothetical protein
MKLRDARVACRDLLLGSSKAISENAVLLSVGPWSTEWSAPWSAILMISPSTSGCTTEVPIRAWEATRFFASKSCQLGPTEKRELIMKAITIAAMMIALLSAATAYSQEHQPPTRRTDEQKKQDVEIEKAYEEVYKGIKAQTPSSRYDPWYTVRHATGDKPDPKPKR